jgi:glycosyltransferase involved in cell wall biosynthesis
LHGFFQDNKYPGLKVSVIIPTYNRESCLINLLEDIVVQDYENFEVIVVEQSEIISFEKKQFAEKYKEKIVVYLIPERGRSLAKNYGILMASGDIILFCDDDIRVPKNFISTHVACYNNPNIGAVSCRLVEHGQPSVAINKPLQTTFYGKFINKSYSTKSGYVTSLNGGNMSFRKEALDKAGFFEEFFIGTSMVEEPDLAYRILKHKYKIFFEANITVLHFPQYNGNIAAMVEKRTEWFYSYFYNLSIFYSKYGRKFNMPFVLLYCLVLSIKHCVKYKLPVKSYLNMVSGYFNGYKVGKNLHKLSGEDIYFTPCRFEKKEYILV